LTFNNLFYNFIQKRNTSYHLINLKIIKMRTKAIYLVLVVIMTANNSCQNIDNPKEIEAVKKVIIDDGEARQNGDIELLSKLWVHEPYIAHFGVSKHMCFVIKGWEEMEKTLSTMWASGFNKETNVVRDNINVHVNGNTAFTDFDLYIYDPSGTIEGKVNASLEKINGEWKMVFLNVIDEDSFKQTDDYWPF